MVSANLVAAVVTLVPGMGLLWYYLHRYEGYFEQNRLFFALVVGLFAGIGIRALEVYFFPFEQPRLLQPQGDPTTGTLVYSFAYTAVGLALLETLGKTAILGFKKFRTRKDTAYYGIAVGVGFGAMWVLQLLSGARQVVAMSTEGQLFVSRGLKSVTGVDAATLTYDAFLFILGFGLLLTHAASAVWVGRGAGEGRLWKGVMHGTLWAVPGLAGYWLWLNSADQVLPALGALAWGGFAMAFADRRVLEKIVPPEIRDMVRRERRREARRKD